MHTLSDKVVSAPIETPPDMSIVQPLFIQTLSAILSQPVSISVVKRTCLAIDT